MIKFYHGNIEAFLLFSVNAKEWTDGKLGKKNFFEIIDAIRNCIPSNFFKEKAKEKAKEKIFLLLLPVQNEIREEIDLKLYRYFYYFSFKNNEIDMPAEFIKKFNIPYKEFLMVGYYLHLAFFSRKQDRKNDFVSLVVKRFESVIKHLTLSREEYSKKLNGISFEEYPFCVRPSYSYPFIENDGRIHFLLPHLIMKACTTSLLFRVTNNDNNLLSKIGKEVTESYLFKLIEESEQFDEVYREMNYFSKEGEKQTSDTMTRKENDYIFFESKSISPRINVRLLDEKSIENNKKRIVSACIQLYKQLIFEFQNSYFPFKNKKIIEKDNLWGIVVIREDSHMPREEIYKLVALELGINDDSEQYRWLCTHIGVVALYLIERRLLYGVDIVNEIKKNHNNGNLYDFWLIGEIKKVTYHKNIKSLMGMFSKEFFQEFRDGFNDLEK